MIITKEHDKAKCQVQNSEGVWEKATISIVGRTVGFISETGNSCFSNLNEDSILSGVFVRDSKEKTRDIPNSLIEEKHPLINPDSPHYQMCGGKESIEVMEAVFTTEELMAWAKITAFKYRMRIGGKQGESAEKESHKIKTYEDYYDYLEKK